VNGGYNQNKDLDEDDDEYYEETLKNNFKEMMNKYKAGGSQIDGLSTKGNDIMSQFFGTMTDQFSEQIDTSTNKLAKNEE